MSSTSTRQARSESKEKFLDNLRSGTMRYRAIDAQAPSIPSAGDRSSTTPLAVCWSIGARTLHSSMRHSRFSGEAGRRRTPFTTRA
jgi:hypothetical protein